MVKFDECNDLHIEFNNVSADLQKVIKLNDGSTREIERETNEVNSEFSSRRNRLHFHEKLLKGVHRTLGEFKKTINDVEEWCDEQKKTANKIDLKDATTAKKDISRIDVSLLFHFDSMFSHE